MARLRGSVGLTPYHQPKPMAGTAVTIHTRPGDNLAIYRAYDFCRLGDVMVIDGGGDLTQALVGQILSESAASLGVVGMVIDGAIRDLGSIRASDFPVYARGVTHRGPYKNGPGEINVPVSVGGMVVNSGDIVVGDENGVLAIAPADAPALIHPEERGSARKKSRYLIAQGRHGDHRADDARRARAALPR